MFLPLPNRVPIESHLMNADDFHGLWEFGPKSAEN